MCGIARASKWKELGSLDFATKVLQLRAGAVFDGRNPIPTGDDRGPELGY